MLFTISIPLVSMRNPTAIVLLAALTMPFVALYFRTHVEIRKVRKEVKAMLITNTDRSEFVLLSFARADANRDLRWKHSKEFEYRGEMYDIVDQAATKDSVYYRCWWDHEETKLHKQLDQLMADLLMRDPAQQSRQHHFFDFFKSLYCETQATIHPTIFSPGALSFPDKTHHIYAPDVKPPCPPPWLTC
jgi:hypothetical protein